MERQRGRQCGAILFTSGIVEFFCALKVGAAAAAPVSVAGLAAVF
jgi:hypothetical protein